MSIYDTLLNSVLRGDRHVTATLASNILDAKLSEQLVLERQHIATSLITESTEIAQVQRIYRETGSIRETELICAVRHLKVNARGDIVSFTSV